MELNTVMIIMSIVALTSATLTARDVQIPCIPSGDPNHCILQYLTNSGQLFDVANPQTYFASANFFLPYCGPVIGNATVGPNGKEFVLLEPIALFKQGPISFGTEKRTGMDFYTPRWTFGGLTWGYENCTCKVDWRMQFHDCYCTIECKPYM